MFTTFDYRRVSYTVSGWLWSLDGDRNGMIVRRSDGRPIRGASIHPGMIQIGLSRSLERAAERALEREREHERRSSDD